VLAHVFEPFFTTKEVGRGTGLGLSMVYGFVKQSGGHVKIYSEEGEGTTVKIYLPRLLRDAVAEDEQAALIAGASPSRHESILVAEDDDDVRAYTVEILREIGYHVLEAHDGPAALRLLARAETKVDLLFTDVVMPEMSGRELAEQARQLRPGLKVLYTSGYTRNAIVHNGRLDLGVEMLPKPFTFRALAEKVRDMLEAGSNGRVLLVEGETTVRMLAAEALATAGYAVDEAANAVEALGKLRASGGRYDAVVVDAALPAGAAGELVDEMRAMHQSLPILLTAMQHIAALEARFSGDRCVAVLDKPYTAQRLEERLAQLGLSRRKGSA
jgi:CheY-like chemotaxis protein